MVRLNFAFARPDPSPAEGPSLASANSLGMEEKKTSEKADGSDVAAVIGPAYTADVELWKQTAFSLIFAVLMAFIGLGFLNVIDETPKKWMGSQYDEYKPGGFMNGSWWWLGVTTGMGLLVGVLRAGFLMEDPPGFISEIREQSVEPSHAPLVVVISAISLAGGASLGPEAALASAGAALGSFFSDKARMPEPEKKFNIIVSIAAAFGALFPAAYLGVLLILEVLSWKVEPQARLPNLVFRMVFASTVAYYIFMSLANHTFLDIVPPSFAVYEIYQYHNWYLAAAVPIGMVSALVGLVMVIFMGVFKKIGAQVRAKGRAPTIAYATFVGLAIGVIGVCMPLTFTSGSAQISVVVENADALGKGLIAAMIVAKMLTFAMCNSCGMIGGMGFPFIFVGALTGTLTHLLVPGLPLLFTFTTMTAAVPCSIIPAPFTFALLLSQSLIIGARATQPIIIAVLVSNACLAGTGVLPWIIQRKARKQEAKSAKTAAKAPPKSVVVTDEGLSGADGESSDGEQKAPQEGLAAVC